MKRKTVFCRHALALARKKRRKDGDYNYVDSFLFPSQGDKEPQQNKENQKARCYCAKKNLSFLSHCECLFAIFVDKSLVTVTTNKVGIINGIRYSFSGNSNT